MLFTIKGSGFAELKTGPLSSYKSLAFCFEFNRRYCSFGHSSALLPEVIQYKSATQEKPNRCYDCRVQKQNNDYLRRYNIYNIVVAVFRLINLKIYLVNSLVYKINYSMFVLQIKNDEKIIYALNRFNGRQFGVGAG